MAASVANTGEVLKYFWSKISGLLKWQADLRNLTTSLITSYLSYWNYLLKHALNKQLFLWYSILKKMDHVCKDYRKVQWQRRRKCFVVSHQLHMDTGFTESWKPRLNLRPFKWVNRSFKRDYNFTPIVSWKFHKELSSFLIIIDF